MLNPTFVKLLVRTGELEFTSVCVLDAGASSPEEAADNRARHFYDEKGGSPDGDEYTFHGGELAVSVARAQPVSQEEAAVLKKFI